MDLFSKAVKLLWDVVLPVIGVLTLAAAVAVFLYAWNHHHADKRESRARRDERARSCTPDVVEGREGLRVWLDFVRDQDLHKIHTPKEPT